MAQVEFGIELAVTMDPRLLPLDSPLPNALKSPGLFRLAPIACFSPRFYYLLTNAIVIVVDRFAAGYLGPYGNTWIDTPAINRLASQGTLFETLIGDTTCLDQAYQSYWRGSHAVLGPAPDGAGSLPQQLEAQGINAVLLTDSAAVGENPLAAGFGDRIVLPQRPPPQPSDAVEQTQLAQLFAEAIELLVSTSQPFLLWLHASAMDGIWDAPWALRAQFADDEDPRPSSTVSPPDLVLPPNTDPDELLALTHAYAGQVAVLDRCLGAFMDQLSSRFPQEPPLLILTSPRGFSLGEHGRVGACGDHLFSEVVHLPALVRHPDSNTWAQRCHTLVQPPDFYATLLEWFGLASLDSSARHQSLLPLVTEDGDWNRQLVCSRSSQQLAIRTPAWFFIRDAQQPVALYAKPDDRWEVNEVSKLCGPIADQLREVLEHVANQGLIPELQEELVEPGWC